MNVVRGDREAGLLFRAAHPAVGSFAAKGYYAAIRTGEDAVVLGTMDESAWNELARAELEIENGLRGSNL